MKLSSLSTHLLLTVALVGAPIVSAPATAEAKPSGKIKNDLAEWSQAWSSLSPEDQQILTAAWATAVDKVQSLTPEQKAAIRDAIYRLAAQLAVIGQSLTPEQRAAIKAELKKLAQAYVALTPAQKQQYLERLAENLRKLDLARAKAAELRALIEAAVG